MGRSDCLVRWWAVSMLVIGVAPASALAGSVSGQPAKPQTARIRQLSASERRSGVVVMALGSGYSSRGGGARVRALQRRLAGVGYPPGPIDGRYGPRTERAVSGFQAARGLRVDGIAGPLTLAALSRGSVVLYPGTGFGGHGSGAVRGLQRRLARVGYPPGPIDGRYGPRTGRAVSGFQAARGLRVDGIAGPRTLARLPHQPSPSLPVSHRTRRVHPRGPRAHTTHRADSTQRQPVPVPPPINTKRLVLASHSPSSPRPVLLALLAALAVALGLAAGTVGYRRVERRGDATGALNLGVLLEEEGDLNAALSAYRQAGQHGSREVAELAHAHATLLQLDATHKAGAEPTGGDPDRP